MSRILNIEDIKKAIVDYVLDNRKTQAVLLDGEWGCGKTFFINTHLIPALAKKKNTKVFKISLYGISSVEMIQEIIYTQWIKTYIGELTDKWGVLGQAVNKGISFLGKPAISLVEQKLGAEKAVEELTTSVLDSAISKNAHNIMIFDDLERCRVDIIQLMGYLNNLAENNGFKLVLVANEKEINQIENPTEEAIKYLVALKNVENNGSNEKTGSTKKKGALSNSELKTATTRIFGEESLYERTKEKLIGLTIPYNIPVTEAFEAVITKYIGKKGIQTRVLENKDKIIRIFDEYEHRNLRTLISACIVIEDVLKSVENNKFSEKDALNEEINTVILYSVYSAIKRSTGKPLFQWPVDTRYTCINNNILESNRTLIYGYAFVDEYWKTQCVDKAVINRDLRDRIDYRKKTEQSEILSQEHKNLALYKLQDWYLLKDEEVKELIQQMKNELREKKYYPYEFKEIVYTLMRINNPDFGMNYEKKAQNSGNVIYESTDASQFVGMKCDETPAVERYNYIEWKKVNIKDFVKLMVSYFDNKEFNLTYDMIRVFSEDKRFAYNYRMLTMPLLEMIEQQNLSKFYLDENGNSISDLPWDDVFESAVKNKNSEFMDLGRFLSLFDYAKLTDHISKASACEIHNFCEALGRIYSFSNLSDIYASDLGMVNNVITYIEENEGKLINPEKSRTKEIAIRKLIEDLKRYRKQLGYTEGVI